MKTKLTLKCATALLALLTPIAQSSTARAQGTAFTYQGDLQIGSAQANGSYDFTFALFNDPLAGAQIGASWTNLNVAVSNGLFTTTVDFGTGVFDGTAYWLALGVRSNASGAAFADLTPRQPITPSPYAIHSVTAGSAGSVAAANIVGALTLAQLPAADVTNGATGLALAGAFTGDGSGLTNLNATGLASGTVADARLSTNVALLNGTNVFAGTNRFSGVVLALNSSNQFTGTFAGNGGGLTNVTVNGSQIIGALPLAQLPAAVVTNGATGLALAGTFTGDGAGLTNLNLLNVSGPLRFPTNAFAGQINFTNTISGITTTNNILLTNCLGVDENYFDSCLIVFRNGSASVESVTLSAAFNNMDATGNTLYLTNVGQLLVWRYTGFDTNFYWRSR